MRQACSFEEFGFYYFEINNLDSSLYAFQKASELFKAINFTDVTELLYGKALVYAKQKNPKKLLYILTMYWK